VGSSYLATTRGTADTTLQENIDTVAGDLTTEATTRGTADTTLQENIDTVAGDLETEATTRGTADTTLQNQLDDLLSEMPFGYPIPFVFMPTEAQMSAWRCLPLQGQVVQISLYQRLCDAAYVGNAANATADWWYKTADPDGTVRDVNGAYMRVLDHQGLFPRAAGQNSKYKMANDAPYDGGSIGAYISDASQKISGQVNVIYPGGTPTAPFFIISSAVAGLQASGGALWQDAIGFDSSLSVRAANETRPASISVYLCIKY
jgi:hypothetical protein